MKNILKTLCLIQIVFFTTLSAHANVLNSLTERLNSYLFKGESLNINEELDIKPTESIAEIKLKVQALAENSTIEISMNNKVIHKEVLKKLNETINLKIGPKHYKLDQNDIKITSNSAFIEIVKANLVSDQPKDDDFSSVMR